MNRLPIGFAGLRLGLRQLSTALLAGAFILAMLVSCGTDEPTSQPSDPEIPALEPATATLDQILERTRLALSAVSSYRSVSDLVTEGSEQEFSFSARYITEWQVPGKLRTVAEETNQDGTTFNSETIRLPTEDYAREGASVWTKYVYDPEHPGPAPRTEIPLLDILKTEGLELISFTELSDEGIPVFRLEAVQVQDPYSQGSGNTQEVYPFKIESRTTMLIDRESFRLVMVSVKTRTTQVSDIGSSPEPVDSDVQIATAQPADSTGLDNAPAEPAWNLWVFTTHSYEYNVPVTIVAPGEFELSSGVTTESVVVSEARTARPGHTPTAIPMQNCSEPGASWPGCGIHTAADAGVMLSVFPDDRKILIGDDVAITFAFDSTPPIDWTVDAYIWYLPDGSRVDICVPQPDVVTSNPPGGGIGRSVSHGGVYSSDEAKLRLETLLDDNDFVSEIDSRIAYVEGRCD